MNILEFKRLTDFISDNKSDKLKVCFVTCEFPPARGGISKSAQRVTQFLIEEGYEVHAFTPNVQTETLEVEYEDNLTVYRLPSIFPLHYYQIIFEMDKILNFDIFHGFFFNWSSPIIPIIEQDKRPLITSMRGIDAIWIQEGRYLKKDVQEILNRSSWITSVSSDSLNIASQFAAIKKKSSFIPNSIKIVKRSDWKKNKLNTGAIGTIAVFREKKNIPLLIKSYSLLSKQLRRKLILVGDFGDGTENLKKEVEDLIEHLNIESEIEITGYLDNHQALKYLKMMNVFVISSDHEGLPNTLFEAASIGLPIVSTAVDGIKDVCIDGENALLVPPNNLKELTEAIESILTDDILAIRLSKGGKELVKKYNMDYERNSWTSLYKRLLT